MAQQTPYKIEVEILYIDRLGDSEGNELQIPIEPHYMAIINNDRYKMSVLAYSIADCFKQLSISIFVADEREKTKTK